LQALKLLRETYKIDLHLALAGFDTGNMQYVRSMAEVFHVADIVHFLGFIPRQDLLALYCGAFALSYMTYFGPENLPPLEAFACSCPVVASNVAGAQEQFGDAALLVDPSSPDEIALAIKRIHDDPSLRASLITKGQKRSKEYTGIDYVRDVFKIMDEFDSIRINWP
jgi:glycosyltransferase involved in cell wall biosynthesis